LIVETDRRYFADIRKMAGCASVRAALFDVDLAAHAGFIYKDVQDLANARLEARGDVVHFAVSALFRHVDHGRRDIAHINEIAGDGETASSDDRLAAALLDGGDQACEASADVALFLCGPGDVEDPANGKFDSGPSA
jgi:hypothetical protein